MKDELIACEKATVTVLFNDKIEIFRDVIVSVNEYGLVIITLEDSNLIVHLSNCTIKYKNDMIVN